MKKLIGFVISIAVAIAMIIDGYIVFFRGNRPTSAQETATSSSSSAKDDQTSSSSQSSRTTQNKYKDGTFIGKSVETNRGTFQVSATISNGKLTSIKVLKYPTDNPKSQSINAQALPVYKSAAVKAQSSKIQHVSGATETYNGFTGSLQDALNKAA